MDEPDHGVFTECVGLTDDSADPVALHGRKKAADILCYPGNNSGWIHLATLLRQQPVSSLTAVFLRFTHVYFAGSQSVIRTGDISCHYDSAVDPMAAFRYSISFERPAHCHYCDFSGSWQCHWHANYGEEF